MKPPDPEESVSAPPSLLVSRVEDSGDVEVPEGYCASVLLKMVDRVGAAGGLGEVIFAWWLVVGRAGMLSIAAPYEHDNLFTVRFDVPAGVELSTAYLLEHLRANWKSLGGLPPDTPVIKGVTG